MYGALGGAMELTDKQVEIIQEWAATPTWYVREGDQIQKSS